MHRNFVWGKEENISHAEANFFCIDFSKPHYVRAPNTKICTHHPQKLPVFIIIWIKSSDRLSVSPGHFSWARKGRIIALNLYAANCLKQWSPETISTTHCYVKIRTQTDMKRCMVPPGTESSWWSPSVGGWGHSQALVFYNYSSFRPNKW